MSGKTVLFIDRDGTLIEEPSDEQVDRLDKVRLTAGVIPALLRLRDAGFRFVMVSNQDGLGSDDFPLESFRQSQDFITRLFSSQGIEFDEILVCPHRAEDQCACRKPATGLVEDYLGADVIDRARSFVIGDRDSDLQLAHNIGIAGFKLGSLDWAAVCDSILTPDARHARVVRATRETNIAVEVRLDGDGQDIEIATGIGFFDHMLEQIARHGAFGLKLQCAGDLEIDEHHTVEDTALTLGAALREALGDKRGIDRYGFVLPMDEACAHIAIDLSGRSYLVFEGVFTREQVGGLPTELVPHFFRSLADALGATIHISLTGENNHHMIEAAFKGVGRCLAQAMQRRHAGIPSTKGVL